MATVVYRVQAPDGAILKIQGPEGASEADVQAAAEEQYTQLRNAQRPKAQASVSSPMINGGALLDTVKDAPRYVGDALNSFATGAGDLAVGAGQFMSRVTPQAILRPLSNVADLAMGGTGDVQPTPERYADAMRQREQAYQAGRAAPDMPDVGRFTGTVVAGGLAGGGSAAATLPGRMLQGAQIGGALGLTSPVDPDAKSYATSKAVQVGGGALLGAMMPPLVEGVIRGTGAAINALVDSVRGMKNTLTGATNPRNIEAALKNAGVPWNQLPQDLREVVINETQRAIRTGGTLDDDSAKRLADFVRLKIQPTKGQLSRDPAQFANELNYRTTEAGAPIAQRLNTQNRQMIGALDELRTNTGASGGDAYSAGQKVVANLRATDAATKSRVNAAYESARSLAGMDSDVPAAPVADRIGKVVEDFGSDNIPGAVASRLREFGFMGGKQTKALTIREAEKLKTLLGNNIDNPNTPTGKALTLIKNGVDDAINSIGDQAGSETAGAFQQARGLAAQRFAALRRTPGLEKAISQDAGGAPEKFIEQQVIRGDVKAVANLMFRLNPQARAEVRAAVLDWIKGKGVNGTEDAAQFTQAGFNKALNALGERKLNLIFAGDKEAVAQLQALGRVGANIQKAPVGSAPNTSNTLTAGLGYLDQAARLPLVGWMFGKPSGLYTGYQAANALRASPTAASTPALSPLLMDRLAVGGGLMGSYGGALMPAMLLDEKSKKEAKKGARSK